MFTLVIALLLQLGMISSASDFNSAEYNEEARTYQGIIIKDDIVY
jgi:hypothetical protein